MSDKPVELDAHRGMAAQKATGLRRIISEAATHAASLRERQLQIETELLNTSVKSWSDAAAKARYVLNIYYATLSEKDSHHRDLVASVLKDFAQLDNES